MGARESSQTRKGCPPTIQGTRVLANAQHHSGLSVILAGLGLMQLSQELEVREGVMSQFSLQGRLIS